MTPGPVSDTYQGPDDWQDLRALLASVSAETEPNKTRLRAAREQFRALVSLAEFAEETVDAIEEYHWPMNQRQEAYSLIQEAAKKRGLLDEDDDPHDAEEWKLLPNEWAEKIRTSKNRDAAAVVYADALIEYEGRLMARSDVFRIMNCAILERWSENALVYIKERAWRLVTK